ncbi:MAG: transglutaminase domain-containing protein, partial [Desulfobacterales bacterium]|nr:transglutaminase domain-containing protein [Desulfobacterales bacterium]
RKMRPQKKKPPRAKRVRFTPAPPGPDDLAENRDIQFSDEIAALSEQLKKSPLKIYEYMLMNFEFEPYLGTRKSPLETLRTKKGNDYDLATLLITILRQSGFPARYISGTVELRAKLALNWLAVDDPIKAASILSSAGMQGAAIEEDGVIKAIQFRTVWVLAHIPYANYRGISNDNTGRMWIPLGPALKANFIEPGVDIASEMEFDGEAFVQEYISRIHDVTPLELYHQKLRGYLEENHPDIGHGDIIRTKRIAVGKLPFIPASLVI